MERVRLTKRLASRNRKADSAQPETAIDLGKNRTYHKIDEYHTFEQTVNHELPDMRHEWKDNPRTETGHGIPKMAKVYLAAKKATKLAMIFLGEKANEDAVERQARAFMRMGDAALTASLSRYADVNGEAQEGKRVADDETVAPAEPCTNCKADDETVAPAEPCTNCKAGDEQAAKEITGEEKATAPAEAPAPAPAEAPAPAAEKCADDAQAETAPAVEEAPAEAPATEEAPAEVPAEGDIEIDDAGADTEVSFEDDEVAEEADDDAAELRACFADDETAPAEVPATETATRKAGLKKLAGQPTLVRVASKSDDHASLWNKWENPSI